MGVKPQARHRVDMTAPEIPVSWGELIDKITILEIRCGRLTEESALAHATAELALLKDRTEALLIPSPEIETLRADLLATNARLWDIEDAIREKERLQAFDDEFIELARSVYRNNDRRAALKRRINILLASPLIEEKSYSKY